MEAPLRDLGISSDDDDLMGNVLGQNAANHGGIVREYQLLHVPTRCLMEISFLDLVTHRSIFINDCVYKINLSQANTALYVLIQINVKSILTFILILIYSLALNVFWLKNRADLLA